MPNMLYPTCSLEPCQIKDIIDLEARRHVKQRSRSLGVTERPIVHEQTYYPLLADSDRRSEAVFGGCVRYMPRDIGGGGFQGGIGALRNLKQASPRSSFFVA